MANGRIKTVSFGPSFLGGILLFCGFAVLAWIAFRLSAPTQTYEEQRAQQRVAKAQAISTEAQTKLYGPPKWIDQTKGTVQVPIDTAMELVINDYQRKPVQPSQVKVENPYPAGLQQMAAPAGAAASPGAPAAPAAASPSPEVKK
jgi:cytoskeletal protein RodZ